jgi:hypothetical protein
LPAAVRVNDEHGPLVGEAFLIGGEGLVEGGRFRGKGRSRDGAREVGPRIGLQGEGGDDGKGAQGSQSRKAVLAPTNPAPELRCGVGKEIAVQAEVGFLAARVLPLWTDSLGVFVRKEAELSQARIVIALRRYEVRKHALPERLDELVPEFLEEIPPDPVDGTLMRYRRRSARRSLVWAIGSDEIDGGGVGPASPWEMRNGIGDDFWDDSQP